MPLHPPVLLAALPKVLELAIWIYDHGFRSRVEGPPDSQYANFGREVRSFNDNLKRLQNALQQAIDSRSQLSLSASPLPEDSLDTTPLNALVGDYQATLKTCRKFLEQNASFERNGAGVIKRIQWSSQLANKITELRNRITFHNVRLTSILRPLELTLYTRLRKDVDRLRQEMHAGFTDVNSGIAAILSRLDEMEGVRLHNVRRETEQAAQPLPELPLVPTYLRASFAHAAQFVQGVHITDQIRLSSIIGHFANGTHTGFDIVGSLSQ